MKKLLDNFLLGMWLVSIFFALFIQEKELIIIAITSSVYAIPLYIRCMKEENEDV